MQLFFHLVYLPILYGKAKSAKRRKQQKQQKQQQQQTGIEKEVERDIFVAITCRKVIKKSTKHNHACKYTEKPCQQVNTSIILAKNALMFEH